MDLRTRKQLEDKRAMEEASRLGKPTLVRLEGQKALENLLPMPPAEGPPLPKMLNLKWPWKASTGTGSTQSGNPGEEHTYEVRMSRHIPGHPLTVFPLMYSPGKTEYKTKQVRAKDKWEARDKAREYGWSIDSIYQLR